MAKKGTSVEYLFDPFELAGISRDNIPKGVQSAILADAANYVLESVLSDVGGSKSPVTGAGFKKLSKDYLKIKKAEGGTGVANLELHGDLMNALRVKKSEDRLLITVVGEKNQLKADNHNKFSPESKGTAVPPRKFIPNADDDETFRPAIRKGLKEIILDALDAEGIEPQ